MMRRTYTIILVLGAGLLALLFMRDDDGGTTATMRPDAEPTLTATEAPSSAGSTGGTRLNNAYLVSLATYQDNVGAFARMYSLQDDNWGNFYAAVSELGRLPVDARTDRLTELSKEQVAHRRDDQRTDQIQCESLLGHGLD